MNEHDAHEGLEKFAQSNGIDYGKAKAEMIPGDASAGWKQLEFARDNKDKAERACVLTWLGLLAGRCASRLAA
jgi:hypothetical protein